MCSLRSPLCTPADSDSRQLRRYKSRNPALETLVHRDLLGIHLEGLAVPTTRALCIFLSRLCIHVTVFLDRLNGKKRFLRARTLEARHDLRLGHLKNGARQIAVTQALKTCTWWFYMVQHYMIELTNNFGELKRSTTCPAANFHRLNFGRGLYSSERSQGYLRAPVNRRSREFFSADRPRRVLWRLRFPFRLSLKQVNNFSGSCEALKIFKNCLFVLRQMSKNNEYSGV